MKVLAAALIVGAMLAPAGATWASTAYAKWSTDMPAFQLGRFVAQQKKTTTAAGDIKVTFVALNYKVNAQLCKVVHFATRRYSCGAEQTKMTDGEARKLRTTGSSIKKNDQVFLELHTHQWTPVRVTAYGTWRAN